jgi:MFS family permease
MPPETEVQTLPRPRLATPAFLAITAAGLAYFTSVGMLFPVLPRFVRGPLGGSDTSVGVVVGVFSLSALFLRPLAGRVGDLRGRKLLISVGAGTAAVSVGAYSLASSIPVLMFLRLLTGSGEAFIFTGATTVISDLAPPTRRGEAFSLFSLAVFSGLAAGPALGEMTLNRWGFTWVWLGSAGCAAAAGLLGLCTPDTRPEVEASRSGIVNRRAVIPGIVFASSAFGFAGYSSFVPLYALQLGLPGSRLLFALHSIIIVAVRSLGARLPDRVGVEKMANASLLLSLGGLVTMGAVRNPVGLVAGTVLFALGQSLAFPALLSLVIGRVQPSERASAIGTFTAFLDLSFGIGPVGLGLVAHSFGYPAVFLASSLVAASGMALFVLSRDHAPES